MQLKPEYHVLALVWLRQQEWRSGDEIRAAAWIEPRWSSVVGLQGDLRGQTFRKIRHSNDEVLVVGTDRNGATVDRLVKQCEVSSATPPWLRCKDRLEANAAFLTGVPEEE